MDDYVLTHYGVKGMRWGVRRNRRQAGVQRRNAKIASKLGAKKLAGRYEKAASHFDKKANALEARQKAKAKAKADEKKASSDHKARVKALKSQIKKNKWDAWDKDTEAMRKEEQRQNKKIDDGLKKSIKALDKQSKGRIDRALGHFALKGIANLDHRDVVPNIEHEYMKGVAKRKEKRQKFLAQADKKVQAQWEKSYAAHRKRSKGKGFLETYQSFKKHDRETSRYAVETYLQAELKTTQEGTVYNK